MKQYVLKSQFSGNLICMFNNKITFSKDLKWSMKFSSIDLANDFKFDYQISDEFKVVLL